jgi:hypothetical protein
MATFNGTMSEPTQENPLISACKRYIAESIRTCDRPTEIAEYQVRITQGPNKDYETCSSLLAGTLPNLEPDGVYGMKRLVCVWRVQGRVNEKSGLHPAYQVDLWIAEYKRFDCYVPLGKRVGLEWVSPVTIG